MAKLRKTRAQKEATAQKRNEFTYSFQPTTHVKEQHVRPQPKHADATVVHVKADLQKTIITSLSLIAAQLLLFYLLQHHIIKIPGASY